MKIAVVTNDERSVSAHFGRARIYLVVTVEDGAIVARETRDKAACDHSGHGHQGHGHRDHDHDHDHDHAPQVGNLTLTDAAPSAAPDGNSHASAATLIADCAVVLSRGMGRGMYANLQRAGVRPVLTDIVLIEDALAAYLAGTLTEYPELVH